MRQKGFEAISKAWQKAGQLFFLAKATMYQFRKSD
jgi:hypothetical protein